MLIAHVGLAWLALGAPEARMLKSQCRSEVGHLAVKIRFPFSREARWLRGWAIAGRGREDLAGLTRSRRAGWLYCGTKEEGG